MKTHKQESCLTVYPSISQIYVMRSLAHPQLENDQYPWELMDLSLKCYANVTGFIQENTTGFLPSAISFLGFSLKHVDVEQLQKISSWHAYLEGRKQKSMIISDSAKRKLQSTAEASAIHLFSHPSIHLIIIYCTTTICWPWVRCFREYHKRHGFCLCQRPDLK